MIQLQKLDMEKNMTDDELINKINNQLDFINFLTDNKLMDYFSAESTTEHLIVDYNNHLPIPIDEKKDIVSLFYNKTFGSSAGTEVLAMMYGLNKKYDVQVMPGNGNSCAGVNKNKAIIEAKIFTDPTIQGFETMAHEIGHVLTGRNSRHIELLKRIDKAKTRKQRELAKREYEGYCCEKCSCRCDAVGEIETMSIEKLFLMFLSSDEACRTLLEHYGFNIDEYINIYEKEHENMAYERMQVIVNTKQLLNKYNITGFFQDKKEFEAFLSQMPNDSVREEFKHDMEQINAKYSFRYVAGEAISKYWFDKYKVADEKEREELKNKFTEFWQNTDKLDIEQASALLCDDKMLNDVVSAYFEHSHIHEKVLCNNI